MSVLGSVRSRIEAGHLDFINEIRPLTCLFLGFPSLLDERDTASEADQVRKGLSRFKIRYLTLFKHVLHVIYG